MLESIVKAASGLKEKVGKKSEINSILTESTNNDNWNISNTKLQILADHTYDFNEYNVIMKHLWSKLSLKAKDWRKIFKALHAFDYLLKNGAPRIVQDLRDDLYKIRHLQDMDYVVEGKDKCGGIREKSKQICELLSDQERLEEEREFARQNREKFAKHLGTGTASSNMGGIGSNSKYQGFGSKDIQNYNASGTYTPSGYDPYGQKKDSVFTSGKSDKKSSKKEKPSKSTKAKKSSKKKKKSESSSEEDSDDSSESDASSDEDSSEDEKPKKPKKKESKGISQPKRNQKGGKKESKKQAPAPAPAAASKGNVLDILEDAPTSTASTQPAASSSGLDVLGLDFGSSQAPAQPQPVPQSTNMFENMNVGSTPTQAPTQMDTMFSNMNAPATQPPATNNNWSNWAATQQTQQPQAPSPPVSNITNTVNLFGNMNISQPVTQAKQDSSASASFNMFEGMSQSSAPAQANVQDDGDFMGFQDAPGSITTQAAPKKDDAWAMGGGLFNLNSLKKDSEKQDKLAFGGNKQSPEKNMLYTQGENLDNAWGAQQNSGFAGNSGFGGAPAPTSNYSGSGFNQQTSGASTGFGVTPPTEFPTNSYNNSYSTGFGATGGANTQGFNTNQNTNLAGGATNSGFGGGFPQTNQPTNSGFGGGFPTQNQAPQWPNQNNNSAGGFPQTNNQGFGGHGFGQNNTNTGGFPNQNQQNFF